MTLTSQVRQALASMKSIHASLQGLALTSTDEHAQREFHEAMLMSEEVIADLKKEYQSMKTRGTST